MELWLDLLFGNPIGILSVLTIVVSIGVVGFIAYTLVSRSGHKGT
jgi:hypothetical protein